jgi:hypothetical protein
MEFDVVNLHKQIAWAVNGCKPAHHTAMSAISNDMDKSSECDELLTGVSST